MIFISSQVSDGNMDFRFGEEKEVLKNRQKFFKRLNINPKDIAEIQQMHGNKVIVIDKIPNPETEADGLITDKTSLLLRNKKGLYLMLKIADCIGLALFDPESKAIALIHVGQRGLEKGIIKNAIKELANSFGSQSKNLIVKFSPSVGPCCYRIDLWGQAQNQLIELGVLEKNIDNPRICTYHTNKYFSHRKSEDQNLPDYRFVTILGLKNVN